MKLDSGDTLINLVNHLATAAPPMLKKGEPEFSFTLLSYWLGKELAIELLSALNEIRLELVPNYADDILLVNAFWNELVCEAAANNQTFCDDYRVSFDLIKDFGNQWKKPLSEFEAIYSLSYLKVGKTPITLHGVEFFVPNDEALVDRHIREPEVASWSEEVKSLTLARVRVSASSSTTAFETGKEQVVNALNLLKVSAMQGLAGKMLPDALFQCALAGHHIVRPVTPNSSSEHLFGFQHPPIPSAIELGEYIKKGIRGLGMELLSILPNDIHERIVRSIHWIAHSTTHEGEDYKIVDLCTALEILLIPEERLVGNKGTVIALRYNLLGGSLNPCAVKRLYDRRNDVVHGNKLPLVTQMDIWSLRLVCYSTIDLIVHASAKQPNVSKPQDLIATIETEDGLTKFLNLADMGIYEGSSLLRLVEEAKKKLKKLRSADRRTL